MICARPKIHPVTPTKANAVTAAEAKVEKLCVFSFDFDGCLGPKGVKDINDVLASNNDLLERIPNYVDTNSFAAVKFLMGTNRQDIETDSHNSERHENMSCYPFYIAFFTMLGIKLKVPTEFDHYLITDTYQSLAHGTSFKGIYNQGTAYGWIFDVYKVTLLYAQLQKIASENPSKEIVFHFFDDNEEILAELKKFMLEHPELIPRNIKLKIFERINDAGVAPKMRLFHETQGTGDINPQYAKTVIETAKACCIQNGTYLGIIEKMDAGALQLLSQNHQKDIAPQAAKVSTQPALATQITPNNLFPPAKIEVKAEEDASQNKRLDCCCVM